VENRSGYVGRPAQLERRDPLGYLGEQLREWREAGTYQRLRELQTACEPVARFDGREVINLASNNYLGLANHPRLVEAAVRAAKEFGAGSGAVRTISGTMSLHLELEERIAAFKHVEACVVFQSGFAANAGTVAAVLTPEDHIISDELNHASIIDGCRLSKAKIHVFAHRNVEAAESKLKDLAGTPGRKLLITDGVFSMDGDIARLPGLVEIAGKHGAIMMVDDAHSSGVLGRNGRGTVDHFGLHGRVDIQVGTLSKAVGVLGGYVCGTRDLIEYLYHRARPFLFSTSHPPAVAASCLAAFDILESEPERIETLWQNTRHFQNSLRNAGFSIGDSETPITPIMVGEAAMAFAFSQQLFEEGLLATGIGFPTVPKGKARVRTIVTAAHTREELDRAVEILVRVARRMEIMKQAL
jgi:glycine C-acetyltransferase